ncbi:hypothetical protein Q043_01965 [Pseudomonas aeruginosa BWHPSA038]|nr:hypothetical protein [Pseudomonas aeruginosa]ETV58001.1 hypothetical protein Q043_01965 [Pseudomonas aeruginosa BWHPSA038]
MDRPNQPGGNETGSDRLFEESWRAAQAGLRKRAQRLARGNSHRAEEWLSSTAVKALLFLRQSPERVRDLDTAADAGATEKVGQLGVADNLTSLLTVLKSFT